MRHKRIWRNICRQNWKRDLRIFSGFLAWHSNRTFRWSWWHAYEHTLPQSSGKKKGMRWKCLHLGLRISLGLSTFHPTNWLSRWIHVKFSRFPSCPSSSPRPPYRRHKVFVRSYLVRSALWLFILRSVCPFALCPVHPRYLKYIINAQLFTDSGNPHNHVAATKFHFVSISSGLPNLLILKALRNDECSLWIKRRIRHGIFTSYFLFSKKIYTRFSFDGVCDNSIEL